MPYLNQANNRKILITGGAGFIGSYLAQIFLQSGFKIKILDTISLPRNLSRGIEYIRGDVTKRKSWSRALRGVTHVVHLAAYGDNFPDFSTCFKVNAAGTALLYEVIRDKKLPIKQVIIASSQSVYGEGKYFCRKHGTFYPGARPKKELKLGRWDICCPKDNKPAQVLPSEEDDKLLPVSPYGISKLAEESIAMAAGKEFNIPTTVLRYAMLCGAYLGMRAIYPNAIKYFAEKALEKKSITLHEDGRQSRDFVDIRDLGAAHLAVLDNSKAYYQAFNVGSGKSIRIVDLARIVYAAIGAEFKPLFRNEFRQFTPRHLAMSVKKIRSLSWKPRYKINESIREYIKAIKS